MNEPASFCPYPCFDPVAYSEESKNPPEPPPVRPGGPGRVIPGFPASLQPSSGTNATKRALQSRQFNSKSSMPRRSLHARQSSNQTSPRLGLPGRDLINPEYEIQAAAGSISNHTLDTDIRNYDGSHHYDTHNFWGSMMSIASRESMVQRRPERRPFLITRSTVSSSRSYTFTIANLSFSLSVSAST